MLSMGMDSMKSHAWANGAETWNVPKDILQVFMMSTGRENKKSHTWANDAEGWNLPEDIL